MLTATPPMMGCFCEKLKEVNCPGPSELPACPGSWQSSGWVGRHTCIAAATDASSLQPAPVTSIVPSLPTSHELPGGPGIMPYQHHLPGFKWTSGRWMSQENWASYNFREDAPPAPLVASSPDKSAPFHYFRLAKMKKRRKRLQAQAWEEKKVEKKKRKEEWKEEKMTVKKRKEEEEEEEEEEQSNRPTGAAVPRDRPTGATVPRDRSAGATVPRDRPPGATVPRERLAGAAVASLNLPAIPFSLPQPPAGSLSWRSWQQKQRWKDTPVDWRRLSSNPPNPPLMKGGGTGRDSDPQIVKCKKQCGATLRLREMRRHRCSESAAATAAAATVTAATSTLEVPPTASQSSPLKV